MGEDLRILILEDVQTDAALEEFELLQAGYRFTSKRVMSQEEYIGALEGFSPDLILSDYDLPQYNGSYALIEAKTRCPEIPFILVTGALGEDKAIDILTQGAKDYVLKSRLNRLVPAVQRALKEAEVRKARLKAEEDLRKAHRNLESQVAERTASLREEIAIRKQAEESLRRSEEKLKLALEASGQGTWDWNLLGGELILADKCKALFGLDADASVNIDLFYQLIHSHDRENIRKAILRAIEQKSDLNMEMRVIWPDGTVHWLAAKGQSLCNGNSKPVRVIGVLGDITERRQLELDLINAKKMETIGILAGGIAHDFNNLLTVIQGYIDLAGLEASRFTPLSRYLQAMGKGVEQAADLTRRLITFSEGGEPVRCNCNIKELIKDAVNRTVKGSRIELTYFIDDRLNTAWIDKRQINQVIRNIVINATEAMPDGGSLKIGAENVIVNSLDLLPIPEGTYAKISITDNGVGIADNNLPNIFDPFFTTKQRGSRKGVGLGLAVCYSIVKRHHGCITVNSQPGKGAAFSVYLPLSLPDQKRACASDRL